MKKIHRILGFVLFSQLEVVWYRESCKAKLPNQMRENHREGVVDRRNKAAFSYQCPYPSEWGDHRLQERHCVSVH